MKKKVFLLLIGISDPRPKLAARKLIPYPGFFINLRKSQLS